VPVLAKTFSNFSAFNNNAIDFNIPAVTIEATGENYKIALTQTHNLYNTSIGGARTEVMKEMTLQDFKKHPDEILEEREEIAAEWGGKEKFL